MSGVIQNVLLTGAKGNIGSVLRVGLRDCFRLRLSDLKPVDNLQPAEEQITCDLRDFESVCSLMQGMDAVVHLGGIPHETDFQSILQTNVVGTQHVFEAARLQGVRRVVYASSNHAIGFAPMQEAATSEATFRPDTFYGVSKVFGEALGRMYHDRYGLEVVCQRIGTFAEKPSEIRHLCTWISHQDMVHLTRICLEVSNPGFAIVYGLSGNTQNFADNRVAESWGYQPRDNAEHFLPDLLSQGGSLSELEGMKVGGSFTTGPSLDP